MRWGGTRCTPRTRPGAAPTCQALWWDRAAPPAPPPPPPNSYMDAVLNPIADAAASVVAAGRDVYYVLQGEMGVRCRRQEACRQGSCTRCSQNGAGCRHPRAVGACGACPAPPLPTPARRPPSSSSPSSGSAPRATCACAWAAAAAARCTWAWASTTPRWGSLRFSTSCRAQLQRWQRPAPSRKLPTPLSNRMRPRLPARLPAALRLHPGAGRGPPPLPAAVPRGLCRREGRCDLLFSPRPPPCFGWARGTARGRPRPPSPPPLPMPPRVRPARHPGAVRRCGISGGLRLHPHARAAVPGARARACAGRAAAPHARRPACTTAQQVGAPLLRRSPATWRPS